MSVIENTTNNVQLVYPGQRRVDMQNTADGKVYLFYLTWFVDHFRIWRSIDKGLTWQVHGGSVLAAGVILEMGSLHVDTTRLYFTYRTYASGQERIYMQAGVITATNISWHTVLLVASTPAASAGAVYTGNAIAAYRHSDGRTTGMVGVGVNSALTMGLSVHGFTIPASGQPVLNNNVIYRRPRDMLTASGTPTGGRSTPAMGLEPGFAPSAWVTFGRTWQYIAKFPWNGSGWSAPFTATRITPGVIGTSPTPFPLDSCASLWREPGWVVAQPHPDDQTTVLLAERNQANSLTTYRVSPTHPAGSIQAIALSLNNVTKDVRVYARTSTNVVHHCDYIGATGLFTSWVVSVATAVTGANNFSVRRENLRSANYDLLTLSGSGPTWPVNHTAQKATYAPFVPTWNEGVMGRPNGSAADIVGGLLLQWTFSDADAGDTQSAWALRRFIGAGTEQYFRASDSTWQATEQKNTGATTNRTLAAGWGADADAPHTYQVKVWDSTDLPSNYSVGYVVLPSTKVNPTLILGEPRDINANIDPRFEVSLTGFTGVNCTLTQSTAFAYSGTKSAKIVTAAATNPKITRSGNDPVTVGVQYTFDAWLYAPVSLGTSDAYVSIEWWNGAVFVSESAVVVTMPVGVWTHASVVATAPVGVTGMRRSAGISGVSPAGLELHIEDAMVIAPYSGTIFSDTILASWTVSQMTAYRFTLTPNPGSEAVYDSGWRAARNTGDAAFTIPYRLPDGTSWTVGLQTRNNEGLASTLVTAGVLVDYSEPPTPTCAPTPVPADGIIRVPISNPVPTAGQPAVAEQSLYRRRRIYTNQLPDAGFEIVELAFEDFEDGLFVTPMSGTWTRSSTRAFQGGFSLRSGVIGDGDITDMLITLPEGTTDIDFQLWVSTENNFDFFQVMTLGGTVLFEDAGIDLAWHPVSVNIPPGQTTIRFRYDKDGNAVAGEDAVFVDALSFKSLYLGGGSGWSIVSGTGVRTSAQTHSGPTAMFVTPDGVGTFPRADGPYVPLTGVLMEGGGWIRPTTTNSKLLVAMHAFDAAGGFVATRGNRRFTPVAGEWIYVETTADFNDLPTAALCTVALGLANEPSAPIPATDTFYVDDAWVTPLNPDGGVVVASGLITAAAASDAVVADTFSRTVLTGWGTPDVGSPWTVGGATSDRFSVDPTGGKMSVNAVSAGFRATTIGPKDADVSSKFTVPVLATGAAINVGLFARYTDASNYYLGEAIITTTGAVRARVRKNVAGAVTTVSTSADIVGLTHTAGKSYRMRFVVEGSSLRVRVWEEISPEPGAWHLDVTDTSLAPPASEVGYRVSLDSLNTNTLPVVFNFDILLVTTLSGGGSAAATVDDWRASGGVDYEYRVIARGANGTSSASPWTA